MSRVLNSHKSYSRAIAIGGGVLFLLLIASFFYLHLRSVTRNEEQMVEDLKNKLEYVEVHSDDYYKGNINSPITVIEYFDLECPGCKLGHTQLRAIQRKYTDKGVLFVYRSFPLVYLHKQAQEEALAHECAGILGGQNAYFSFMEKVYFNTKSNDTLDLSLLPQFAKGLSLDVEAFNSCRKATSTREVLNSRISRGLAQGVYSTPSYVVLSEGSPAIVIRGNPFVLERLLESLVSSE